VCNFTPQKGQSAAFIFGALEQKEQGEIDRDGWRSTQRAAIHFLPEKSRVWSERQLGDWGVNRMYDLAPDGKRFAVILDMDQTGDSKPATSVTVLVNFLDELRRRVPLPRP